MNPIRLISRQAMVCLLGAIVLAAPALAVEISSAELATIQSQFRTAGLPRAGVDLDDMGRVLLTGHYENRQEVQKAFSIAQSYVGVKRVAPTTPENIRYPVNQDDWRRMLDLAMQQGQPSRPATRQAQRPPQKFALLVGIQQFRDNTIRPLTYPAKDAADIQRFLLSREGGSFPPGNVTLLSNRAATRHNIEQALDGLQQQVRPGDTVVVYLSSHGAPPNDQGNLNVVTYDTVVKPREQIFYTSLGDERLRGFINSMHGVDLLLVLDTCYSGAAFSKVPGFIASGAKDLFVEEDRNALVSPSSKSLRYFGTPVSQPVPRNDLPAQRNVKVLLSASSGEEKSWESDNLRNGIFTYYLLDGLRQTGEVRRAYDYARPLVERRAREEKSASQTPQFLSLPETEPLYLKRL
ncbi:caspase family protein [Laribacter hongkongensis]|nr:caspase family protein [Laribacter hongkongensis]